MDKSKMLIAGIGQGGCTLANLMKLKDGRYTNIFVNSSLGDMKGLTTAKLSTNVFIYSGGDGSGSDRDKGKEYIINDSARLMDTLNKYKLFKYVTVYFSTDGGTGSGSIIGFVSLAKSTIPNIKINLVGILPNLKEDNKKLENSKDCVRDLNKIMHLINDLKFINNNKGKNYDDINERAINDIDNAYSMLGHHDIGSIDEGNLENICTAKGYGVVLNLPSNYSNYDEAINTAKVNSIFAMPSNITECEYGGINVKEGTYKCEKLSEKFKADETLYKTYGKNLNLIVLGGCEVPSQDIQDIEDTLTERKLRKSTGSRNFSFNVNDNSKEPKNENTTNTKIDDNEEDRYSNFNPNKFIF